MPSYKLLKPQLLAPLCRTCGCAHRQSLEMTCHPDINRSSMLKINDSFTHNVIHSETDTLLLAVDVLLQVILESIEELAQVPSTSSHGSTSEVIAASPEPKLHINAGIAHTDHFPTEPTLAPVAAECNGEINRWKPEYCLLTPVQQYTDGLSSACTSELQIVFACEHALYSGLHI